MRKHFLLSVIVLAVFACSHSQMIEHWSRVLVDSSSSNAPYSEIYGMDTDAAGNAFVLAKPAIVDPMHPNRLKLAKYSPAGFPVWETNYDGGLERNFYVPNHKTPNAVQVNQAGQLLVLHQTYSNSLALHFEMRKYLEDGTLAWSWNVNAAHPATRNYLLDWRLDASDNIYVLWYADSIISSFISPRHLASMTSNGTLRWEIELDIFPSYIPATEFYLDQQGGFYVVCTNPNFGNYHGIMHFLPDATLDWDYYHGWKTYREAAVDPNGGIVNSYLWGGNLPYQLEKRRADSSRAWNATLNFLDLDQLLSDAHSNVYCLGRGPDNLKLVKFDSTGQQLWQFSYNPPIHTLEYGLEMQLVAGSLLVYGVQEGGPPALGGPTRTFILRLDEAGNLLDQLYHPLGTQMLTPAGAFVSITPTGHVWATQLGDPKRIDLTRTCVLECTGNLSGKAFFDPNQDCQQSPAEIPLPYRVVEFLPGPTYALTDTQGRYQAQLDTGSRTLDLLRNPIWANACQGGPYAVTVTGPSDVHDSLDFGLNAPPVLDVAVIMAATRARRTARQFISIAYTNLGTLPANAYLEVELDTNTVLYSSPFPPDSVVGNHYFWGLGNLPPFYGSVRRFEAVIDTFAPLGIQCVHRVWIHPIQGDLDPSNNGDSTSWPITGSWDPNDKTVQPSGTGPTGEIDFQTLDDLSYTIRFQNTGNDTAYHIVVRDTLSPLLDLSTFQMGVASHNYRLELTDNRILTWSFDNINLPDSTTDLAGSNGYLKFRIKPLPGLPLGTQLANKAAIYFDFNLPIITNTALLTNALPLVANGTPTLTSALELFPNPAQGRVTLRLRDARTPLLRVQVCDLRGAVLLDQPVRLQADEAALDISALPPGIYLVQASQGAARHVQRLLVW
jgi:Secretion system C-terminal sorting domain